MPRTGENIYKRKDRRWEGRCIRAYKENGKAIYKSVYAKSYAEVKQKLKVISGNIFQKDAVNVTLIDATFATLIENWLQNASIRVKDSTFARYYRLVHHNIIPKLGKYPVSKISAPLIEGYVNQLLTHGRLDGGGGLSSKTVSDILVVIKSAFKYAEICGYTVACRLDRVTLKKEKSETRTLTAQEQNTLTAFLLRDADCVNIGILLSLLTGIRIGELCALKWENINLAEGILKIRRTLQRIPDMSPAAESKTKIVITVPKSDCSIRDIPLPEAMILLLRKLSASPDPYLLTGTKSRHMEPRTVQNRFKSYLKQAGLPSISYHMTRHSFATRCVEAGVDVKCLSEMLGHANVSITLNRYVHSSFDLKRANINKPTANNANFVAIRRQDSGQEEPWNAAI